jgi:hypothetical protein
MPGTGCESGLGASDGSRIVLPLERGRGLLVQPVFLLEAGLGRLIRHQLVHVGRGLGFGLGCGLGRGSGGSLLCGGGSGSGFSLDRSFDRGVLCAGELGPLRFQSPLLVYFFVGCALVLLHERQLGSMDRRDASVVLGTKRPNRLEHQWFGFTKLLGPIERLARALPVLGLEGAEHLQ